MPHQYTLRDAKARLSELLDLAAAGSVVEITRQGAKRGRFKLGVISLWRSAVFPAI